MEGGRRGKEGGMDGWRDGRMEGGREGGRDGGRRGMEGGEEKERERWTKSEGERGCMETVEGGWRQYSIIQLTMYILVGYKHRASEGVFYIGSRGCVLCQFIESVTFARCTFIFALQNIILGGYLDTRRNI